MKYILFISILAPVCCLADELVAVPQPYPMERYEAGWNTNPFTLKTAPAAVKKESFAKDLALGSMFRMGDVTTVVLVNTKSRDRIRLFSDQVSSEGIRIKSANILSSRRDSYAEIEKGGESAVLRYDDNLLKQLIAQNSNAHPNGVPPNVMESMHNNVPQGGRTGPMPPLANSGGVPPPPIPGGERAQAEQSDGGQIQPPASLSIPQRRRILTGPRTTTP